MVQTRRKRKAASDAANTPKKSSANSAAASATTVNQRKPFYDERDRAALRLMRKLRVDWSTQEDSFLLLCKVAGAYLCQNSRNQMVQYTAVRDLLHRNFTSSHNKTSRACQRRLNYVLKNVTTVDNVTLFLADLRQDEAVSDG